MLIGGGKAAPRPSPSKARSVVISGTAAHGHSSDHRTCLRAVLTAPSSVSAVAQQACNQKTPKGATMETRTGGGINAVSDYDLRGLPDRRLGVLRGA